LKVRQYGSAFDQSLVAVGDTIESNLTSLEELSVDNNEIEELSTNTTKLLCQFDCQPCNILFTSEILYNKHVNEMHNLESNNQ
jgi:Leucine-rich repeat (LRR) protein